MNRPPRVCECGASVTTTAGRPLCDACKAERRRWRGRLGAATGPTDDGRLKVSCWCERGFVLVPADDVRNGLTADCRRPNCHPPALVEVPANA